MNYDQDFLLLLEDAKQEFSGWDFSYVSETGRFQTELLPWSYGSMAICHVRKAKSLLDMGTGGGEFLSRMKPLPEHTQATEGYEPNIAASKGKLEPLGVTVSYITDDSSLPYQDKSFDLILNRHESYSPAEVRRIVADQGVFLTQQVGGADCSEINEALGVQVNPEFSHWNLQHAVEQLTQNSFKIVYYSEHFPIQRFYDIGALVYYLKAISWQVPGFHTEEHIDRLYQIHRTISNTGFFNTRQHRFVIKAEAV
ncbi:class I SAM-dependent methyltransferase [Peribacillus kribbensis]|uniref:class I SAM-dependent methyltransferase n=1 Tax=Peribacillus kribbensis TaxID=356658 RepID=UPI00042190E6|nr:methyltransferase domain-containing protein [Peribacillus kribbensis]